MNFDDFMKLTDPSGLDDSVPASKIWKRMKIVSKLFQTPRKRTFPSGKTPLTIWGGPPAVIKSVSFMKSAKILKIYGFHQFSTFSSIWWLLVVSTTLYRAPNPRKCWKYCSNISKRLGNTRFRAVKAPLTIWGGLPVLVGSLNFVSFQKSWKIMIFDDFRWFSSFPDNFWSGSEPKPV